MERTNDAIRLCGEVRGKPELSHYGREGAYYKFPLAVRRLSGTEDVLNIVMTQQQLEALEIEETQRLKIWGEVRSFNNRSGVGPRLIITVLSKAAVFTDDDFDNTVLLTGTLCKEPTLRRTPMGREICDMMLAVNRSYGRSDYLPLIAWGAAAREAAELTVGSEISVTGRLQSRKYIKMINGEPVEKTAFEISVVTLESL